MTTDNRNKSSESDLEVLEEALDYMQARFGVALLVIEAAERLRAADSNFMNTGALSGVIEAQQKLYAAVDAFRQEQIAQANG